MQAIVRIDAPEDVDEFVEAGQRALAALAGCTGFTGGELARSTDEPGLWVLCTRWDSVGAYRRALSNYDVKLHATPFMYLARDEPSGFEPVLRAGADGVELVGSDLATDADRTAIGDFGPWRRGN